MTRPVRPIALVLLTACMVYPGVTMLYQGLYVLWAREYFNLAGQVGPWLSLGWKLGVPPMVIFGLKAFVGLLWVAGVPGLWAGDMRAYPLVLGAAVFSLLYPGGPMVMGVIALVCLIFFRENPEEVPA
jgi:hypothetical protein